MSRIVGVLILAFVVSGCTSSAATGSPQNQASGATPEASESISASGSISPASESTAAASAAPAGSAAPRTSMPSPSAAAASGGTGASGAPPLAANLCDMLDQATIERITGLHLSTGQQMTAPKGYISACTWAQGQSGGFDLSAQTEAVIRSEIAPPPAGYKSVNGLGIGAKAKTATLFYTNIKEVSLIVNEGAYGLVFGLTATTATVAQDVALAKAVL